MRVFVSLAVSMVVCKLVLTAMPLDFKTEGQRVMLLWPALAGILVYGAIGVVILRRSGFTTMTTTPRGVLVAMVQGAAIGVATSLIDWVSPVSTTLGVNEMHHPLPEALPVYWYGAVFSEIWYHLLPVPVLMLACRRIADDQRRVFWLVLILLSTWEGRRFFTDPLLQTPFGTILFCITYAANASEIWLFRRHGFMAAVVQRMSSYAIWHIAWPAISGRM